MQTKPRVFKSVRHRYRQFIVIFCCLLCIYHGGVCTAKHRRDASRATADGASWPLYKGRDQVCLCTTTTHDAKW